MATSSQIEDDPVQGYDAKFEPEVDRKYLCPVCLATMRDAMQTSCGHRFCQICITNVANGRTFAKCPVDNMWFRCEDELFSDNAVRREILSLTVKCNNVDDGCEWHGELRSLEGHVEECRFVKLPCPNICGEAVFRGHMTRHLTECECRKVTCPHCQQEFKFTDLMKHQVLFCMKLPMRCTLCGEYSTLRENFAQHINTETGDCPGAITKCQFLQYGCQFQDQRRKMADHHKEAAPHHVSLLLNEISSQKTKITELTKANDSYQESMQKLESSVGLMQVLGSRLTSNMAQLTAQMNTSYNGTLQWKIPLSNSQEKCFLSDSFYTSRHGYKVCVCLELEGHREGSDVYASFFVMLQKGEHDDNLRFPFNFLCHVVVYGQTDSTANEHHSATIYSANVPRCTTENDTSNSRRGRLRFMKTEEITSERFTSDGHLYLDIHVDHTPLNRTVPYQ